MNKAKAKEKIKKLVQRYEKLSEKEIKKDYNEERTKTVFIQPLFEILGWDFQDDVWPEKEAVQGRADYAFMLGGLTKFFVEAKPLRVDLDIEIHARQAINYSWNKGVAWAALTDFEGIKIFNAQAQSKLLIDKLVFEIPYSEYISDFDRLWLLSKESFEKNGLDQYAVKHGKKIKKLTVNEKLFSDLKEVRKELTKGFCEWNEKINKEVLEEGVQRIIERLMFIRVLEDKKLENPVLIPVLRKWEKNKNIQLFTRLITKFRELDDIYNSDLFDEHACEDWEEYSVKWDKIFSLLYGSQVHEYDFKEIPADILGGVYESYLGHIAQNPIKASKQGKERDKKEIKTKSRQKRKEQGIYYTPKFIVDYIVENTLGKKLEEVKSMRELKQIKVLDPACGSGSFLNKALQAVNDKYKDFGNPGKQETKSEILMSNIYGVDLDPQAVELAKLNLLVSALDKKAKLPDLTGNVRVGNSLISGNEKELKKYFGKDWREKRPFNWEEEFPFCHSTEKGDSGFDVVIGNPPYITLSLGKQQKFFSENDIQYFNNNYKDVMEYKGNTYALFIAKSISLLKKDGLFSFIIPNTILLSSTFKNLRKFILNNCSIEYLVNIKAKVFGGAETGGNLVFVLKKKKAEKNHKIKVIDISDIDEFKNIKNYQEILQQSYCEDNEFKFFTELSNIALIKKIEKSTIPLGDIVQFYQGIITGDNKKFISDKKETNKHFEILRGRDINRYGLSFNNNYILFDKKLLWSNTNEKFFKASEKLINRQTGDKLIAAYDNQGYFTLDSTHVQVLKNNKFDIKYILALFNSKLFDFIYKKMVQETGRVFAQVKTVALKKLPIKNIPLSQQKSLALLANKILKLNKQLQSIPENSDKWNSVKREIEKVDGEIDERVFGLYGLGEGEREIINNN